MTDGDFGDVTVAFEFESVHAARVRITFGPHKTVRLVLDHLPRDVVMVAEQEVLLANEALAESVGLFPLALECEISEVVNDVAGTNHGVVAIRDGRVHFFYTGERPPLPKLQNVLVVNVIIAGKKYVWFR